MPEKKKIYVGDSTKLVLYLRNNLTSATAIKYRIWKPNGDTIEVIAFIDEVWNNGTSRAKTSYDVVATNLDEVGDYSLQAYVTFTANNYHSITRVFHVYAPYQ